MNSFKTDNLFYACDEVVVIKFGLYSAYLNDLAASLIMKRICNPFS